MKDRGTDPKLTRAYEIGFTNLAEYCVEEIEKRPETARANIMKYIDKFYSKGIYSFIMPKDKELIDNLRDVV